MCCAEKLDQLRLGVGAAAAGAITAALATLCLTGGSRRRRKGSAVSTPAPGADGTGADAAAADVRVVELLTANEALAVQVRQSGLTSAPARRLRTRLARARGLEPVG
jgi:hypothetical protein